MANISFKADGLRRGSTQASDKTKGHRNVSTVQNQKLSGYLFMSAGAIFFAAALVGAVIAKQPVFYSFFGIGAAFFAIGAAMLHRTKRK